MKSVDDMLLDKDMAGSEAQQEVYNGTVAVADGTAKVSAPDAGEFHKVKIQKQDLWKDPRVRKIGESVVHMTGIGSDCHTVFARVAEGPSASIGDVVDVIVDEGWKQVAKTILEKRIHIEPDSYPPAKLLLELGAVWLLNETSYTEAHGAHAHRLAPKDETMTPEWKDMTLRVHYVPDRFHAVRQYDWTKYCRGLLVGNTVEARLGEEVPHVPIPEGLPDTKDGVIVYEDENMGFAILNKPGQMPIHATISNHLEDLVSSYKAARVKRKKTSGHVAVLQRFAFTLNTETYGLVPVSIKPEFTTYLSKMMNLKYSDPQKLTKKFRCLVCVKKPETMDVMEDYQDSGKLVTHYLETKTKRFLSHKPKGKEEFQVCQLKIIKVGDDRFRAACVRSVYKNSIDACLAHRLWEPTSKHPAEELGVQYVMELEIELITTWKDQIRGQLAAMGLPVVGDFVRGGGRCDMHAERRSWNRLALQCCELSFMIPEWKGGEEGSKKELVPTSKRGTFRLREAWWTEHLAQYEMFHEKVHHVDTTTK